ncbi:MAG: hypothetical protein HZB24_08655, partial [Desulfobacterales bacterium]|nr:hypothetical protein [Desulfobacterales bacterium]
MRFNRLVETQPIAQSEEQEMAAIKAVVGGSNDFYGATSLEHFSSASGLTYTHEDAQGFLDYPTSFTGKGANFWLKDAGVKVWEYEEAYDNWQDTYGMDSVMVFYHSGHGNMDGNGIFQAPLGAKWDNRDWAFSNKMAFANEELRYLFWSTCFSLRVSGPDNPVRTWWQPNQGGLRMLFGYETTSVDDPDYGKFFWEEWKKGKTFARAFLDASWRISHDQVPVAMSVGANANEAINRLNTERFFTKAPATKGWYQWQWIGTLPERSFAYTTKTPKKLNALIFDNKLFDDERMSAIAQKVGISKRSAGTIKFDDNGNRMIGSSKIQVNVNREGALNIYLGKANIKDTVLLEEKKAVKIARELIGALDFDQGIELKPGHVRHRFTCGGTLKGSGRIEAPAPVETIVQFRQSHKGLESVNSDHGLITVCIDNDGSIINVYNSTKAILGEADKPRSIIPSPPEKTESKTAETEAQFDKAISGILGRRSNARDRAPDQVKVLSEKVGYDFSSKMGLVVRQRNVDV